MRAGIITIPNRNHYLNSLTDCLEVNDIKYKLFIDYRKQGAFWNYMRMFKEMLQGAKKDEPILLCTDDVITTYDFRMRFEKLHAEVGSELYTFFTRQRHLLKYKDVGYVTKVQKRGWYDQASVFINQQDLPNKVETWFETHGKYLMNENRQKHHDVVIQDYFVDNNIPWTITVPTFFEHTGVVSSLGHDVGQSILYIGNV
jgi:hypothetical protein